MIWRHAWTPASSGCERDIRELRAEVGGTNGRIDSLNQTIIRVGGALVGGMMHRVLLSVDRRCLD